MPHIGVSMVNVDTTVDMRRETTKDTYFVLFVSHSNNKQTRATAAVEESWKTMKNPKIPSNIKINPEKKQKIYTVLNLFKTKLAILLLN